MFDQFRCLKHVLNKCLKQNVLNISTLQYTKYKTETFSSISISFKNFKDIFNENILNIAMGRPGLTYYSYIINVTFNVTLELNYLVLIPVLINDNSLS